MRSISYFYKNMYGKTVTECRRRCPLGIKNINNLVSVNCRWFRPSKIQCASKRNLYGEIYKEFIGNNEKQFNK